ncbi:hypothetical protein B0I32_118110 [Nonomuraea fuscirosea]|uniref:Uncharacterized protein n=1 Tax=Nonomuraea fuscirosea TaxID=1291556 RepID=A0A2T0MPH8_9ACTN|nr:hypothetical protein B0I32_118110 [Nonomuraea fuscirosea]
MNPAARTPAPATTETRSSRSPAPRTRAPRTRQPEPLTRSPAHRSRRPDTPHPKPSDPQPRTRSPSHGPGSSHPRTRNNRRPGSGHPISVTSIRRAGSAHPEPGKPKPVSRSPHMGPATRAPNPATRSRASGLRRMDRPHPHTRNHPRSGSGRSPAPTSPETQRPATACPNSVAWTRRLAPTHSEPTDTNPVSRIPSHRSGGPDPLTRNRPRGPAALVRSLGTRSAVTRGRSPGSSHVTLMVTCQE